MGKIKQITIASLIISLLAISAILSGIKPAQATIPDVLNTVPNTVNFGEVETCLGASYINNFYISNVGEEVTASIRLIGSRSGFSCSIDGGEMKDNWCGETKIISGGRIGVSIKLTPPPKRTGMGGTITVKITDYAGKFDTETVSLSATGKCTSIIPVAGPNEVPVPPEDYDDVCNVSLVSIDKQCYVEGTKEEAFCGDACHDFVSSADLLKLVFWNIYKVDYFPVEEIEGGCVLKWRIAADVCSIADKLASGASESTPDSHLRYGKCQCGSVGDEYKECCSIPSSGSSTLPTSRNAIKYYIQDKFPPVEGTCGEESACGRAGTGTICTVIEPDVSKRPANCPMTTLTLTASRLENNPTTAKVTWNAPTADWCGDGNFVTKGAISGAVETSNIPADNKFFVCCKENYNYAFENSSLPATAYFCTSAIVGGTDGGGCTPNCGRCSNDPAKLGSWVDWYDPDNDLSCDSGFNNCPTYISNDPRCRFYYCPAPSGACTQTSGSYATLEDCQTAIGSRAIDSTCYQGPLACGDACGDTPSFYYCSGNQCVNGGATCLTGNTCYSGDSTCGNNCVTCDGLTKSNINLILSSFPQCLPKHFSNGTITRSSTLTWSANVSDPCGIIGGGSPSPSLTLSCEDDESDGFTSWLSSSQAGSGEELTGDLTKTTKYGLKCSRGEYTCSNSDEFISMANCDTWCGNCGTDCASCGCGSSFNSITGGGCQIDAVCVTRECAKWTMVSCNIGEQDCVCDANGQNCKKEIPPCTEYGRCIEYSCSSPYYEGTRTSKKVCPFTTLPGAKEETVRVAQRPRILSFEVRPQGAGSDKPFSSLARILLTKLAEFKLGAKADSSGFFTKMACELRRKIADTGTFTTIKTTGSVQGSDSLTIQNPTLPFTDSAFYQGSEPPYKTSLYQLYCKNQSNYSNESNCYDDQTSGNLKVEPYGTDLEPKAGWLKRIRDIFLTTRVNTGLAGGE